MEYRAPTYFKFVCPVCLLVLNFDAYILICPILNGCYHRHKLTAKGIIIASPAGGQSQQDTIWTTALAIFINSFASCEVILKDHIRRRSGREELQITELEDSIRDHLSVETQLISFNVGHILNTGHWFSN